MQANSGTIVRICQRAVYKVIGCSQPYFVRCSQTKPFEGQDVARLIFIYTSGISVSD